MELFRGTLAALMCISLLSPSGAVLGEPAYPAANQTASRASGQLQGDDRILQALNRFTFGPRPGDLEAVKAMGLENWFNRQLHPETLDETDLNARLAQFPAMRDDPQQLLYQLPSNAIIRQIAYGKASIPANPELRPIYENELARVEQRMQAKEQKKQGEEGSRKMAAEQGQPIQIASGQTSINPAVSKMDQSAPGEAQIDPSHFDEILALPAAQRVDRLAAMTQPEFDSFHKFLKPRQRRALVADMSPEQSEYVAALENPQRVVADELAYQRLTRDIYSPAQLQEVMTDFWLNHFNVYLHKNDVTPYYLVSYERDVIRPLALGKFENLLEATAHSPAMLLYLDNASSVGPDSPVAKRNEVREQLASARTPGAKRKAAEGLNENYARELMELQTLGVNGGYTQADVIQVARVLTGWTVDRPQRGGGFKFEENRHEPGTKKVLGKKIKQNGEQEGRQLLHMLATRPATAQFICRELAIRFVSDDPPQSLVNRMAKSFHKSGGDISVVLTTLFHSPEFWASDDYRAKVKTPIEFVVSAVRASNASIENMQPLVNALHTMGMPLYGSVPPTGYNWQASTWVSTGALVNRMNFALSLAANRLPGITVAWPDPRIAQPDGSSSAGPGADSSPAVEEQTLESLLVAGGVSETTRAAVLQQLEAQSAPITFEGRTVNVNAQSIRQMRQALERQDQLLAGLLLGSPAFQRR